MIVIAPGYSYDIPECYKRKYHKMLNNHDTKLIDKIKGEDNFSDDTGLILLVELDNLVGITPFAIRETGSLLYLEALTVITEKKGRRYEIPQLGMLKHIS